MILADASPIWYWAIVIPYMFVLIGIGLWTYNYQKKQKTATDEHDDYWIAKRGNSALVVGCAIAAGWFLIGFITWAMYNSYMYGIGGIWAMVVPWMVLLFTMVILVPNVRRFKAISQPQMLQQRFGLGLRVLVSPFNIFCFVIWSAAEIWSVSQYLAPEFGVQPWVLYIVFAVPVAVYMALGGFHAVISANLLQFAMGVAFVTIVFVMMTWKAFDHLPAGQSMYHYLSTRGPAGECRRRERLDLVQSRRALPLLLAHRAAARVDDRGGLVAQGAVGHHHARGAERHLGQPRLQHHLDPLAADHHRPLRPRALSARAVR